MLSQKAKCISVVNECAEVEMLVMSLIGIGFQPHLKGPKKIKMFVNLIVLLLLLL